MRVIAFIEEPRIIDRIIRHLIFYFIDIVVLSVVCSFQEVRGWRYFVIQNQ